MSENTKHKIKLTELEMQLITEAVENTSFFGRHSFTISSVRKKMTIKEKKKADIADINQSAGGTD